jgi:predicted CoA-binding protein
MRTFEMPLVEADDELRHILTTARTIAVVGLSNNPARPSYVVAAYLVRQGYTIFPINPTILGQTVLGREVYASLSDLAEPPDIVDVFRRPVFLPDIAEQAIASHAPVLWTQLGVRDAGAVDQAVAGGLAVVQDRCIAIEHRRLGIGPRS